MRSRLIPRKIFFGWYIVAAGMVINMLIGGLVFHSFSFYVAELKAEFLWSASLFAFAFTLTRVESGVLGPIQGWLIDRFSPRTMIRWGVGLTAVGMIAFSRLWDPGSFIGFYFLISIGASVGGFMTISVVTVTWFERLRSRALGFMAMGFGLGGFWAPVVGSLMDAVGWRWTAIGTGVLLMVVGLALSSLFVRHPRDKGMEPDGGPASGSRRDGSNASVAASPESMYRHRDFTAREALRTRSFWALALAHGAPLMVVSGMMVYFATRVQEIEGLSAADAGLAWLVMSACQLVGQLTMGYLGDVISKRLILYFCMLGHGAAGVLLGIADSYLLVMLCSVVNGLAWGARGPLITALRADYFGASSFGQIMGWSSTVMMLFMVAGSLIVGTLRDVSGDFMLGFLVVGIGAGSGVLWVAMATRPRLAQAVAAARRLTPSSAQLIAVSRPNRPGGK
ncbi:MAG: MFS transporter [Chloroflexota bacterium]|nr:MFS transporter [Chloroflexota bacterium]